MRRPKVGGGGAPIQINGGGVKHMSAAAWCRALCKTVRVEIILNVQMNVQLFTSLTIKNASLYLYSSTLITLYFDQLEL